MRSQSRSLNIRRTLCYIVLILLTFFSLFPFIILLINASRVHSQILKGFSIIPGTHFMQNWKNLYTDENIPILRALFNSIYVSVLTAFLTSYFSAMTAYGIHLYHFKGRNFAFKFIMLVMMVPGQVSALGFLRLIDKLHLMDSLIPLYLPAIASPITFFFMLQYLQATLPYEIIEASRVDGCNEFRTFNVIVLPMIKPAIAVQSIFAFVGAWNNYFIPALIINSAKHKTIPILIAQLRSADYLKFDLAKVYMMICVAIIPLLIIYLFLSRYIISGVTLGGIKE